MKALAYVSDEMYVALPDVAAEFESEGTGEVTVLRSSPRGAFYGDLKPGRYRVTLSKAGYGSKISLADLGATHLSSFDCCPTAWSATCGRNGSAAAKRPNTASTPASSIRSRSGDTAGRRSSSG